MKPRGCFSCTYLWRAVESWELPHIAWWECGARAGRENLKGFPWKKTKCRLYRSAK